MAGAAQQAARQTADRVGLPAFCDMQVVFAVMVLAQLVVTIVAVTSPGGAVGTWRGYALLSLFVQWLALAAISLLCVLRNPLARLGVGPGLFAAWLLVLGMTGVAAAAAWWLDQRFGLGMSNADTLGAFLV